MGLQDRGARGDSAACSGVTGRLLPSPGAPGRELTGARPAEAPSSLSKIRPEPPALILHQQMRRQADVKSSHRPLLAREAAETSRAQNLF